MATAVLYGVLVLTLLVVLWFLWWRGPKEGFQSEGPSTSCVPKYQSPLVLTFQGNPDPQVEDISVTGSPSSAQVPQSIQTVRGAAAKIYRIPLSRFQGYDTLGYLLVNGGGPTTSGAFLKSWSGRDVLSGYIKTTVIKHASLAKTDRADPIKLDGGKDVFVYVGIPDRPTGLVLGDGSITSPQGSGLGNGPVGLDSGDAPTTNFTGAPNKNGYAVLVFYNEIYFPQFTVESNVAPTNVTETSTDVSVQFTAKDVDSGNAKGTLKLREEGKDEKTVDCSITLTSDRKWECKASLTDLSPGKNYTYNFIISYTVNSQEFIQTSDALSFRTRDTLSFDQVVITSLLFDRLSFRLPFRTTATPTISEFGYRVGSSGAFMNLIGASGGPSGTVQIAGNDCSGSIVGLSANTNYNIRVTLNIASTPFPAVFNVSTPHNLVLGTSTPTTSDVGPVNATIALSNITASGTPTVYILYKTPADIGYTTVTAGTGMSSNNSSFTGNLTGLSTLTRYSIKLLFTLGGIVRETSDVSFTTLDHSVTFRTSIWVQQSGSFTAGTLTFPFTSSSPNFDSVLLRIWKTEAGIGTADTRTGSSTGSVAAGYVFTTSLTGLSQNQQYTYQLEVRLRESSTLFKSGSATFTIIRDVFVISNDTVTPTTATVRASYNTGSYQDIQNASVGVKVGVSGSNTMTSYPGTVVTLTGLQPETKYVYTPFLTSGGTTFESPIQKGEFTTSAIIFGFGAPPSVTNQTAIGAKLAFPITTNVSSILSISGVSTRLEYKVSSAQSYNSLSDIGTMEGTNYTYTFNNLENDTEYNVRVIFKIGSTEYTSSVTTFRTLSIFTFDVLEKGANFVTLQYGVNDTSYTGLSLVATDVNGITDATVYTENPARIYGLTSGSTYYYKVSATLAVGTKKSSAAFNVTTRTDPYFTATVSNITHTSAQIQVNYKVNSFDSKPSIIQTGIDIGEFGSPRENKPGTTINLTGLKANTVYEFITTGWGPGLIASYLTFRFITLDYQLIADHQYYTSKLIAVDSTTATIQIIYKSNSYPNVSSISSSFGLNLSGFSPSFRLGSPQSGLVTQVSLTDLQPSTEYTFNPTGYGQRVLLNRLDGFTIADIVPGKFKTNASTVAGFENPHILTAEPNTQPLFKFGASLREVFGI